MSILYSSKSNNLTSSVSKKKLIEIVKEYYPYKPYVFDEISENQKKQKLDNYNDLALLYTNYAYILYKGLYTLSSTSASDSIQYYKLASSLGSWEALQNLGHIYYKNCGDDFKLLKKSAIFYYKAWMMAEKKGYENTSAEIKLQMILDTNPELIKFLFKNLLRDD